MSKALLLDIGVIRTKIMQISKIGNNIQVLKTAVMEDMKPFITESTLCNLKSFTLSLKDMLHSLEIKPCNVYVCGEVFGSNVLRTTIQRDVSDKTWSNSAIHHALKIQNADAVAYQLYPQPLKRKEISCTAVYSKVNKELISAFCNELSASGFNVVRITDTAAVLWNLGCMHPCTYDINGRIQIYLGSRAKLQVIHKNIPKYEATLDFSLESFLTDCADELETTVSNVKELLFTAGTNPGKSPIQAAKFASKKVNADAFAAKVLLQFKKLAMQAQEQIAQQVLGLHLRGYTVSLVGDCAGIPGVTEIFEDELNRTVISLDPTELKLESYTVKGERVAPAFQTSFGLLSQKYHTYDLIKNVLTMVDTQKRAMATIRVYQSIIVSGALCIGAVGFAYAGTTIYRAEPALLSGQRVAANYLTASASLEKYKGIINAANKADSTLAPLLAYTQNSNSSQLVISSIDSDNLLSGTVTTIITGTQIAQESTPSAVTSGSSAASGSSAKTKAAISPYPKVSNILEIRGYAENQDVISDFFKGLATNKIGVSRSMKGIQSITLPTGEKILMFEIEVDK